MKVHDISDRFRKKAAKSEVVGAFRPGSKISETVELDIDLKATPASTPKTYTFTLPIPANVKKEPYIDGFTHRIKGGHLTQTEHFKQSFRAGFRVGGELIDEQRAKQGTPRMPQKWQMRTTPT